MVTKIVTILTRKLNCDHFIVNFYNLSQIGHNRKFVTKKEYIVTNIVVARFIFSCNVDLILADMKSACFLPTCSEGPEGKDLVLGEGGGDAAPGLDKVTGKEGA